MIKAKLEYALKHYVWLQQLYKIGMSTVFKTMGLFVKTDPNLILYNSMIGRASYDSPLAIFNYLKTHPEYNHFKHVWAFNEPEKADGYEGCRKVKMDSLSYFLTALKAGYWITNVNIERSLHFKKKGTRYLNTWHGVAFNHIGNDVPGRNDYNSKDVDYICYESEYSKQILMRALGAKESSMLPSGLPRNDELYNVSDDEILELKKKLGLPLDKKIIMYAPTWRDSENCGKSYEMAPPIDFKKWKRELGNDYVIFLRTHHLTTKLLNVEFDDFVINGSDYPKINDMFKISDILISDYSACIADYSILERPIICFAYDYDEYRNGRGFYIDFENDLPIDLLKDENDVIKHIKNIDWKAESEKTRMIKSKFTNIGGNATEMCVKALFGEYKFDCSVN